MNAHIMIGKNKKTFLLGLFLCLLPPFKIQAIKPTLLPTKGKEVVQLFKICLPFIFLGAYFYHNPKSFHFIYTFLSGLFINESRTVITVNGNTTVVVNGKIVTDNSTHIKRNEGVSFNTQNPLSICNPYGNISLTQSDSYNSIFVKASILAPASNIKKINAFGKKYNQGIISPTVPKNCYNTSITYQLFIPNNMTVKSIETTSGDITACFSNILKIDSVKASSGNITLKNTPSLDKVKATYGNICIQFNDRASFAKSIKTSSGNITLKNTPSLDKVKATYGNICIQFNNHASFVKSIKTSSGNITLRNSPSTHDNICSTSGRIIYKPYNL